jgi:haloalkane dehalogenase
LRIHYVDEGPEDGELVLLLHGEPSWSFLYRKMIPTIAAAGYRVIAPDLVGFGRSDKPARREDYTYQRHVNWVRGLLRALDLRDITLVCHDWGGLIGLRLAAEHEWRFSRIVASNTFLPSSGPPNKAFLRWRSYSQEVPAFHVGSIIKSACVSELAPDIIAAYNAPFPDERYKVGVRQFPLLVPITPSDPAAQANRSAWEVLKRWEKPFLTAFSDSDPITRGYDTFFQATVPGAQGQPHRTIVEAGHFLQEDKGPELAQIIVSFMESTARY